MQPPGTGPARLPACLPACLLHASPVVPHSLPHHSHASLPASACACSDAALHRIRADQKRKRAGEEGEEALPAGRSPRMCCKEVLRCGIGVAWTSEGLSAGDQRSSCGYNMPLNNTIWCSSCR